MTQASKAYTLRALRPCPAPTLRPRQASQTPDPAGPPCTPPPHTHCYEALDALQSQDTGMARLARRSEGHLPGHHRIKFHEYRTTVPHRTGKIVIRG